jgi:hypothetical protein
MTDTDHIKASLNALDQADISSSLAHGQVAVAQSLRGIDGRLDALVEVVAHAVGVLLDGKDVYTDLTAAAAVSPVPDPAAERAYRIQQLADHLSAAYDAATVFPVWPTLAEAALVWMERSK